MESHFVLRLLHTPHNDRVFSVSGSLDETTLHVLYITELLARSLPDSNYHGSLFILCSSLNVLHSHQVMHPFIHSVTASPPLRLGDSAVEVSRWSITARRL
jgi:hypothetical protein